MKKSNKMCIGGQTNGKGIKKANPARRRSGVCLEENLYRKIFLLTTVRAWTRNQNHLCVRLGCRKVSGGPLYFARGLKTRDKSQPKFDQLLRIQLYEYLKINTIKKASFIQVNFGRPFRRVRICRKYYVEEISVVVGTCTWFYALSTIKVAVWGHNWFGF